METKASASTGHDSNFALKAEDAAEVLQLDVDFGGHDEYGIEDVRGSVKSWAEERCRAD
jgi:hypothetical protein